jgi:predicted glycoside hydrolase/deacetylase ChbG (UPF0249 family)
MPQCARPECAVVFHADDFGMNRSVTEGIIRGFTHGLLTSTSLLTNAPDAPAALRAWRELEGRRATGCLPSSEPRASLREPALPFELGIHLNLTQGRPLTRGYPPRLLDEAGCFCGIGRLFRNLYRRRPSFEGALRSELAAQIEYLLDHGFQPTHLNGHQYVELLPGLRDTLRALVVHYRIGSLRVAREERLLQTTLLNGLQAGNWCLAHVKRFYAGRLLREARRWEVGFPDAFFGTSHAGRVDLSLVRQFLVSRDRPRLIEIGLHPAIGHVGPEADGFAGWKDPLAEHRPKELEMLTSSQLVELLHSSGKSLGRLARSAKSVAARAA